MGNNLHKFPSTPHLAIAAGTIFRNDKVLNPAERNAFLTHKLLVQEKVDGANLGISFDASGDLKVQNRGEYLQQPYAGQWRKLEGWLGPREEILFDGLSDRLILFGEWCYAKHSIRYDYLPDWFLAFDVFDKDRQRYFSFPIANRLFTHLGLQNIPVRKTGYFSLSDLWNLTLTSSYVDGPAEGVYLRVDEGDWLNMRAKLVRPEFSQSIQQHWSRTEIVPNRLETPKGT